MLRSFQPRQFPFLLAAACAAIIISAVRLNAADLVEARRLETEGVRLWKEGKPAEGIPLMRRAVDEDPINPVRRLNLGSVLFVQLKAAVSSGDSEQALSILRETELQLTRAVQIWEGLDGDKTLSAQAWYLLGEIATYVRRDRTRAAPLYKKAAALNPAEPKFQQALARVGNIPPKQAAPADYSLNGPASFTFDQKLLNFAFTADNGAGRIREYVPQGETVENWTELAAVREHPKYASPRAIVTRLVASFPKEGTTVISSDTREDHSATIVYVIHAPSVNLSELNVWQYFEKDGTLFSHQYARRYKGPKHAEESVGNARSQSTRWLRQLQDQNRSILAQIAAKIL